MDLGLNLTGEAADAVRASYACPCGCTPSVAYRRATAPVTEGCCCGNEFAVGSGADVTLAPVDGVPREIQWIRTPWGESIPAVWNLKMIDREHSPAPTLLPMALDHHHGSSSAVIDPVCGMSVEPDVARARGLSATHADVEYFFCGRGCKLDFEEDPERYLKPGYTPTM